MSNIVSPHLVPDEIKKFAEENIKRALSIGNRKLNITIPFEGVQFFKKSRTAGYVYPMIDNVVYLNLELLKQNMDHFANDTIPHEVAHLFASKLKIKKNLPEDGAHGKTWKMVMRKVYGLKPTRCHSLDTTGVGKYVAQFRYICNCKKHDFSSIRHNKVQKGERMYRCNECKSTLTFLSKID